MPNIISSGGQRETKGRPRKPGNGRASMQALPKLLLGPDNKHMLVRPRGYASGCGAGGRAGATLMSVSEGGARQVD